MIRKKGKSYGKKSHNIDRRNKHQSIKRKKLYDKMFAKANGFKLKR